MNDRGTPQEAIELILMRDLKKKTDLETFMVLY